MGKARRCRIGPATSVSVSVSEVARVNKTTNAGPARPPDARRIRADLEDGQEAENGHYQHEVEEVEPLRVGRRERVRVYDPNPGVRRRDLLEHAGDRRTGRTRHVEGRPAPRRNAPCPSASRVRSSSAWLLAIRVATNSVNSASRSST
jgi:hypothetical protein